MRNIGWTMLMTRTMDKVLGISKYGGDRNTIYEVCPKGIQPFTMKTRDIYWRRYKNTRNTVHRTAMPLYPLKWAPWDLTQFSQSPSAASSYFPKSHWQSKISSLLKVIVVWGKARSCRVPNLGCSGAESPGWFDGLPKKLCTRHDAWAGTLLWWSCQSPVALSLWPSESSE